MMVVLVDAYKNLEMERDNVRELFGTSQEKAFRRISELQEQINLDQQAKRDLELNYRLLLDEKDEFAKVLRIQVPYQIYFLPSFINNPFIDCI
ncbi:unnamed protein product [Protopolystoma xenopodis]|uniref:Uncharacterized protein n=1 Tax=Protopolystoma xenopodis TaxID=117903 RepID=A0A448XMM4_9PLAT|nr:unnamed protein product [Protopolystoma xenopodis]